MTPITIVGEYFLNQVVFLEPGSTHLDCHFSNCRLVWYEGFECAPAFYNCSCIDCHLLSFSEYLEECNKEEGAEEAPENFGLHMKPQAAIPWYVNGGKRW